MTCREKLKIEHPEAIDELVPGGCRACPESYGYLPAPEYCGRYGITLNERCSLCWDREITDVKTDNVAMSANDYQKAALRTESVPDTTMRILQGVMGLSGEAGECLDLFKKHLFQGHDLEKEHLARELGDVAWYLAICADAIGYSLNDIFQMNIDKLKARYPEGFDENQSLHRKDGDI